VVERWEQGQSIVRREVLGLGPHVQGDPQPWWHGKAWEAIPVYVVEDTDDGLVTYIPEGAQLGFVDGGWPTPDGKHPWHRKVHWQGHGCLMVQRPGDPYAVWHFWTGPNRDFACWYINLQADFVRTEIGYDTQDFELDFIVSPDGSYGLKDAEVLDDRVSEGRFTAALVEWVRQLGAQVSDELDAGRHWWDRSWSSWEPPAEWRDLRLPEGWADAACPSI
jgi:hypothetical protein